MLESFDKNLVCVDFCHLIRLVNIMVRRWLLCDTLSFFFFYIYVCVCGVGGEQNYLELLVAFAAKMWELWRAEPKGDLRPSLRNCAFAEREGNYSSGPKGAFFAVLVLYDMYITILFNQCSGMNCIVFARVFYRLISSVLAVGDLFVF